MAADYSSDENKYRKLFISVDFGTANSAVAHTIGPRNDEGRAKMPTLGSIPPSKLRTVDFNRDMQVSSQLAWFNAREQWVWGHPVDDLVGNELSPNHTDFRKSSSVLKIQK